MIGALATAAACAQTLPPVVLDRVVMKDNKGAQIVYRPAPLVLAEIAIEEKPARDVAERYLEGIAGPRRQ